MLFQILLFVAYFVLERPSVFTSPKFRVIEDISSAQFRVIQGTSPDAISGPLTNHFENAPHMI